MLEFYAILITCYALYITLAYQGAGIVFRQHSTHAKRVVTNFHEYVNAEIDFLDSVLSSADVLGHIKGIDEKASEVLAHRYAMDKAVSKMLDEATTVKQ